MKRTLAVDLILGVALQLASVRVARAGDCKVYWTSDWSSAKYKVYDLKIYKTSDFSSADIRISKDHLPK